MLQVKPASPADIPVIEGILLEAVEWFERTGKPQWTREKASWSWLSAHYPLEAFRIADADGTPAGCMALPDDDPLFWPELAKGASLYLHKLAVGRSFAGRGVSDTLIAYAQRESVDLGMGALRLDCCADRPKVRALYERHGFVCVREACVLGKYPTAFYVWEG